MEDTLTGGCLCGAVRYEAKSSNLGSFICYCRMCQRVSGSAFAALLYVKDDGLRIIHGNARPFESSPGVIRSFCGRCGSPLFFRRDNRPGQCAIVAGSLDTPNRFVPQTRIFLADAVSWLDGLHAVDGHSEKPPGMTPPLNYNPTTGRID